MGPYTQPQDYTHMYDLVDLPPERSRLDTSLGTTQPKLPKEMTMYAYLESTPDLSKFFQIVLLAGYASVLDMCTSSYTILAVEDENISDEYMKQLDICRARRTLWGCMIHYVIPVEIMADSAVALYETRDRSNKALITRGGNQLYVDGNNPILKGNIRLLNGMIHIVSKLRSPVFS